MAGVPNACSALYRLAYPFGVVAEFRLLLLRVTVCRARLEVDRRARENARAMARGEANWEQQISSVAEEWS